ncbi:MAG: peptidylprolyl isomerase [Planctomycetes bacterium]|nr:peptidylprolyl isomerase [Planctomycetota bacterium]
MRACSRRLMGVVVAGVVGLGAVTPAALAGDGDAVVMVNGQPISKRQLVDLLMEAHGLAAMQQLIVLELAQQETRRRGIVVTEADVHAEFQRSLDRIAPEAGADDRTLTEEQRQSALNLVLEQKGISLPEFMIGMERNAHLRKIVQQDFQVTEATLREEFARTYGEKVLIRHIQVEDRRLNEVLQALQCGKDFAEVARTLSQNTESAARGGELAPFTFLEETLPAGMREMAFSLAPSEVSPPIRLGKWNHILKLEKRIPPENQRFEDVRAEVRQRLCGRVIPHEMSRMATQLFQKAKIRVLDQSLRRQYEKLLQRNAEADVLDQP